MVPLLFPRCLWYHTQTPNPVDSSAELSMSYAFGSERSTSKNPTEPQQTPNYEPCPTQFRFVAEKDGVYSQQKSKQPSSDVGAGFAVALQSPWGQQIKRQRTTPTAREDPCCGYSTSALCSERHGPWVVSRVPCIDCDPGSKRCGNTTACHNLRIDRANRQANNTSSVKIREKNWFGT